MTTRIEWHWKRVSGEENSGEAKHELFVGKDAWGFFVERTLTEDKEKRFAVLYGETVLADNIGSWKEATDFTERYVFDHFFKSVFRASRKEDPPEQQYFVRRLTAPTDKGIYLVCEGPWILGEVQETDEGFKVIVSEKDKPQEPVVLGTFKTRNQAVRVIVEREGLKYFRPYGKK